MINWLKNLFKKKDNNEYLLMLNKAALVNRTLLDCNVLLQERYEVLRVDFITWLGAAALQNNGELILKKDFIDAIITNPKLTLKLETDEEGNHVIKLVEVKNE
jgi:hypothetical protein